MTEGKLYEGEDEADDGGNWFTGPLKFKRHIDDDLRKGSDGRRADDYAVIDPLKQGQGGPGARNGGHKGNGGGSGRRQDGGSRNDGEAGSRNGRDRDRDRKRGDDWGRERDRDRGRGRERGSRDTGRYSGDSDRRR